MLRDVIFCISWFGLEIRNFKLLLRDDLAGIFTIRVSLTLVGWYTSESSWIDFNTQLRVGIWSFGAWNLVRDTLARKFTFRFWTNLITRRICHIPETLDKFEYEPLISSIASWDTASKLSVYGGINLVHDLILPKLQTGPHPSIFGSAMIFLFLLR